ncbi:hypothetical protein DV738_g3982, partial [Chaetothyriales sp. CBS 135597]
MCRLCGRVIKCIFDSMPSRAPRLQAASSIVGLTTPLYRSPITPASALLSRRAFSALSPALTTRLSTPITPLLSSTGTTATAQRLSQPFSTSSALQGYRRRMDTFSPSRRVQKRRHGYLARLKTKAGRNILKRRQLKGKRFLSW